MNDAVSVLLTPRLTAQTGLYFKPRVHYAFVSQSCDDEEMKVQYGIYLIIDNSEPL